MVSSSPNLLILPEALGPGPAESAHEGGDGWGSKSTGPEQAMPGSSPAGTGPLGPQRASLEHKIRGLPLGREGPRESVGVSGECQPTEACWPHAVLPDMESVLNNGEMALISSMSRNISATAVN